MGTTKDALTSSRGVSFAWIAAIEGFPYLITNGSPAAAVAAFTGTDWTQAIGGLFVDMDRKQEFNPFNPFPRGGSLTLRVVPDANDTLGIQLHRNDAGASTVLRGAIDCDDTTVTVADTTTFPAAPGEMWIGNECVAYTGKTGTTFTGCTRGKYSPFRTSSGAGFARPHRAGYASAFNVALEPVVSEYRRQWAGAKVGLWLARDVGGVLDVRAEAQLVFAGEIAEYRDDGETGQAAIEVVDLIEVGDRTLMRDQFRARIADGMWIDADHAGVPYFEFKDWDTASIASTANPLYCKVGATGTNEFPQGFYTVQQLASIINAWLQAERVAGRINGEYSLDTPCLGPEGYRTVMKWQIGSPPPPPQPVRWRMSVHRHIAVFLGISENVDYTIVGPGPVEWEVEDSAAERHISRSDFAPMRWYIPGYSPFWESRLQLIDQEGIAWDNHDWFPEYLSFQGRSIKILPTNQSISGNWGVFTLGGKPYVFGAISGNELRGAQRATADDLSARFESGTNPPRIELAQIYVVAGKLKHLLLWLFHSTGTRHFNHPLYDEFPQALSLAIPSELLGPGFISSLENAPFADQRLTVVVDKPLDMMSLTGADLILRGMHLVWRAGLEFRVWSTPEVSNAVAILSENSKALPAGQRGSHRTPTAVERGWLAPIVKVMFDRDWASDQYTNGPLILEDRGSIDDLGGDAPEKTIKARNMGQADVQEVAAQFLALMPNVSRPAYKIRRTINQSLFEVLTPGDTVLVNDGFARDPGTGRRGQANQPGIITSIDCSYGGPDPRNPRETASQGGEVEIVMYPGKRFAPYSPAALVDATANADGFTAGYHEAAGRLRLVAHEFSELADPTDASRFTDGDMIEIIERDPVDPSSPIFWERGIAEVVGDDFVLDAKLDTPTFDPARQYYVRSQRFSAATETQRVNAYQADDADARIENEANPYHYSGPANGIPYTSEDHTAKAELVPAIAFGDGRARDVAEERALIRLLNGLMDHRTAHQSPVLWSPAPLDSGEVIGFRLVLIQEHYFGRVLPNSFSTRFVSIAPHFRSSSGTPASVRVTLLRTFPNDATLDNVQFAAPYEQFTWTTTSTTWQDGAPHDFDLRVIGDDGIGVIAVELSFLAETRGLSRCRETERRS